MKENKNITCLNCIHKTCEMGIVGINDVIDNVSAEKFRDVLVSQREEYSNILSETEKLFVSFGTKEKELSTMLKANSKVMSEMKLLAHNSDNMIAKMMMEGTNKGIIKINKALNENSNTDTDVKKLGEKLLKIMEHNYEEFKIYL